MATSTLAKPNIRTHLFLVVADLKTLLFTRGGGPYTPTILRPVQISVIRSAFAGLRMVPPPQKAGITWLSVALRYSA